MPEATDLLAKLDAIAALVAELRAELAASLPVTSGNGLDVDSDLAPENLIEISTASARWNRPSDTLRYWCRREDCGVKVGGRWMASVPRIQRRLNGE